MRIVSLQSGSNGNCIYLEAAGVRLLFDAGISGLQAQERLARHGRSILGINALLISHDHSDHVRSLGVFQRKFGLPAYVTAKTLKAAAARHALGCLGEIRQFQAGGVLRFGRVRVETIPTPHDGADGVAFVVDDGRSRLGILTDLGHVFGGLEEVVSTMDAAILESNYDPQMLAHGSYPAWLKRRIRGPGGHLSNHEAAELVLATGRRLKWLCLAHLSEENNHPRVALRTHREVLGDRLPLHVASRYEATGVLEV
jgi:phosphoribosyl 1,2-cyclic phosphodiesterase